MSLSLGVVPLALFLLYASREDAEWLSIRRRTLMMWLTAALAGWWWGAWPFAWAAAAGCYAVLWIAGTGRGDRLGGLLVGGLLGPVGFLAVALALAVTGTYCLRRRRAPQSVAFYPFLSLGTAVVVAGQCVLGFFT